MRLFIGIPLAQAVVRELAALVTELKSASDGLRWSAEAGWHITLQFLGRTTAEQFDCVTGSLRLIRCSPFEVQLEPPGFFDRAGVFFAGVRLSAELSALQAQVVAATGPCGFVPEDRPYHPHITLAREKAGHRTMRKLKSGIPADVTFSSFRVEEFLLYQSFPGPEGSRYEARERFAMKGSPRE
jgi:2'-5' RNA ligase